MLSQIGSMVLEVSWSAPAAVQFVDTAKRRRKR